MKNIETEITIKASAEKIWGILTNLQGYAAWNPFIIKSEGKIEEGEQLVNTMKLEGRAPQVFKPSITGVRPGRSFRWLGSLFVRGLFDGEHYFELEPLEGEKTRLIHGENFRGILVNLIMKMIGKETREGFQKMNHALKNEAEKSK